MDHRFDKIAPEVAAAPAPTPSRERSNPFEVLNVLENNEKSKYYDSVAAAYGLGVLHVEAFVDYTLYDAFVTNLRIFPVQMTDDRRFYYVDHCSFLPHVPGSLSNK